MRWSRALGWAAVLLAGLGVGGIDPARAQEGDKVSGRVLDRDGKPVAGAEVAATWSTARPEKKKGSGRQSGFGSATTDVDGRFTTRVPFYGRDRALMALDADQRNGGLVVTDEAGAKGKEVEIRLAPLVRVHAKFTSSDLGKPTFWTNTYVNLLPGDIRLLQCSSTKDNEASMFLPPGEYKLHTYGSDVTQVDRTVTLRADQPDVDLGTIDIPATFLARHRGKELPPWSVVEARGVKKDVTLADYRGKWVLVDFWGYWCGPCVRQLGEAIDFYADYAADRDKFEILAFHDGTVKDFSEMDAKLERTKAGLWHGRGLPFPILLDAPEGRHGATVAAFGITAFPTTILIDPEGKLVGQSSLKSLGEKLTPIPLAVRVGRAMDRDISVGFDTGSPKSMIEFFAQQAGVPININPDAQAKAEIKVPLSVSASLSLRSWLELLLDPVGLEAVPGADGIAIVPMRNTLAARTPSDAQRGAALRIERALDAKVSLDLQDTPLSKLIGVLEEKTQETFLLDPAGRLDGSIDPDRTVSASLRDMPVRQALEQILKPLGLFEVVKDEAVVISKLATP